MAQQLLRGYFQKRSKAARQGEKIQHSCSKVSQLHLLTSALNGALSYSYLKSGTSDLNISNHANLH